MRTASQCAENKSVKSPRFCYMPVAGCQLPPPDLNLPEQPVVQVPIHPGARFQLLQFPIGGTKLVQIATHAVNEFGIVTQVNGPLHPPALGSLLDEPQQVDPATGGEAAGRQRALLTQRAGTGDEPVVQLVPLGKGERRRFAGGAMGQVGRRSGFNGVRREPTDGSGRWVQSGSGETSARGALPAAGSTCSPSARHRTLVLKLFLTS